VKGKAVGDEVAKEVPISTVIAQVGRCLSR
jgi:hypothetical protein